MIPETNISEAHARPVHSPVAQAEIVAALATLRRHLYPTSELSQMLSDEHQHDLMELRRLKLEMDAISQAIQGTKREIATLHYAGVQGREMARATDELGAIVLGTESATHSILEAAEAIDALASAVSFRLHDEDAAKVREINERVLSIFEACNFQDITGQRIGKVVSAMRFVEERIDQMIAIWGGLDSFREIQPHANQARTGDQALLNGPALDDEERRSQDDVDALFS
jgi:chemotaxis protein CheZ